MATHFNAFISYRHSPLDSKIAQQIHRQLERFKIPKAIQKRTGIKKIDRIFRDKEELPLSVNLSDDINEALIHSDFLIVICSPRFQESQWCMREIDLFLQTHPVERILIVLAEGEPDDVVPPILTQNREPLCCDYRMKPRKAKLIELPRLVSAILGCRYDELRQRQRQYRMRRLIALFSSALVASLCLTAYFIHTSIQIQKANEDLSAANVKIQEANVQIQDNLDQALLNQSQYLTSASQERLEAGDRLMAIALALEALPGEDDNRPYIPDAEHALNDAISAYRSEATVSAMGSFSADALIQTFRVTEDGKAIYILDARGIVTIWDTVTFQKTGMIDASAHDLKTMFLTNNGNVLFATGNLEMGAVCYGKDGTELWQMPNCKSLAFLNNGEELLLLQDDYKEKRRILFLDPDTGKEVAPSFDLFQVGGQATPTGFLQKDYISGKPITVEYLNGTLHTVFLVDVQSGQVTKLLEADSSFSGETSYIDSVCVNTNGDILVMQGDESGMYNGSYQTFEITGPDNADILCFDAQTQELKWSTKIVTYIYGDSALEPIPNSNRVLCRSGNTLMVLDSGTGAVLGQCQTPANPLTLTVEEKTAWGILENGTYFTFRYEDSLCYATTFMDGTVNQAVVNRGYFILIPLGTQITVYRSVKDEGSMLIECADKLSDRFHVLHGDRMLLWDLKTAYLFNISERKLCWQKELGYGYDALGFSQDGSKIWMWNDYDEYLSCFDVSTGTQTDIPVDMEIPDAFAVQESNIFLFQDKLYYMVECDGVVQLRRVDLDTGNQNLTLDIPSFALEKTNYSQNTLFLTATEEYAWVWKDKERICVINLENGNTRDVVTGVTVQPVCLLGAGKNEVLIAAGNSLLLADIEGTIQLNVDLEDRKGASVYIYGSELLVLCDDGIIYRYDRDGKLLGRVLLELYNTFSSNASNPLEDPLDIFWCFTSDGELILNAFGAGNIITCDTWQAKAFVPSLCAYVKELDEIVCLSGQQLYVYSRYTTAEQMEKARQTLGSYQLTEEQKKYYGLS